MTDQESSSISPTAQASTLHPLHLLDTLLTDLETKDLVQDKKQEEILRAADFLLGGSILEGALSVLDSPDTIRLLQSSHRSVYLVRGGGKGSYYCSDEITYCSCRSFLERAKTDPKTVCKHLLALKLMPHFNVTPTKEIVSDEDYGKIVMLRVFVD